VRLWLRDVLTAPNYLPASGLVRDVVFHLLSVPCRGTQGVPYLAADGFAEVRVGITEEELVEALRELVTKRAAKIVGTDVVLDLHGTSDANGREL